MFKQEVLNKLIDEGVELDAGRQYKIVVDFVNSKSFHAMLAEQRSSNIATRNRVSKTLNADVSIDEGTIQAKSLSIGRQSKQSSVTRPAVRSKFDLTQNRAVTSGLSNTGLTYSGVGSGNNHNSPIKVDVEMIRNEKSSI